MSIPEERARRERRRMMHERQAVVFGIMLAVLAVGAVTAAAVMTDTISLPFLDRGFSTPSASTAAVPCPPTGALPVQASAVQVTVLNGAGRVGLAASTANSLAARGFDVVDTGNATLTYTRYARVVFGAGGITQAYTLAAHLDGAVLTLDPTRAGAGVDLVLGQQFTDLLPTDKVTLDPAKELARPAGCVNLADLMTVGPTTVASAAATR